MRRSAALAPLAVALLLLAAAASAADEKPPVGAEDAASSAGTPPPAVAEASGSWPLPAPGACAPEGGLIGGLGGASEDAVAALPFAPGDVFDVDRMEVLEQFLPDFIWAHRDRFFFEGMRLEIGPCFRDYAPPAFFQEATERFRGEPRLLENGGLEHYTAGLPFAPDTIAPDDPRAGLRWLWNVASRYEAGGFRGPFRMTDLVGRVGRAEPFEGEMFKILLAHRADRADSGYVVPGARDKQFVAGGIFEKPFDAREHAWRQYRDLEHLTDPDRSDDLHAYLPQWRRVRRINANQVEGLYMPSFSVGVQPANEFAVGGGGGAGAMSGVGGAGAVGGTIQNKRSGYEGLEIRPLLYQARVVGLHDVLAPINAVTPAYPEDPDRDFGPWGLSFGGDRWDLRRALVLDLTLNEPSSPDRVSAQRLYVDLQTLHPLYMATFDDAQELTNVGMYAARWSEDREDYPRWPDDETRPVRVLDSVGAAFANLAEAGSWRRESWSNVSVPPPDRTVKRMISVNELTKGR
jgi:hypothetical protein